MPAAIHVAPADLSCNRLQRALEPSHHFARSFPAAGLVREAHKGAQLRLASDRMMEAQIVGGLRHHGVERGVAGEAEDVVGAVILRPFHEGAGLFGATFGDRANLSGATFGEGADLYGATFRNRVNFKGWSSDEWTKFCTELVKGPLSNVWQEDRKQVFVQWEGVGVDLPDRFSSISFAHARFRGIANFSGLQFVETADFNGAQFDEPPHFDSMVNIVAGLTARRVSCA